MSDGILRIGAIAGYMFVSITLIAVIIHVPTAQAIDGVCVKFCDDGPSSSPSSSGGSYGGGGGGLFNWGPTPQQRNSQLHAEGLAAFREDDFAKAVRLFEEALDAAFDPTTKLMLVRSRELLAYYTGRQAYDSKDYVRSLRFMREALQLNSSELILKQTDVASRRTENIKEWIADLEGRVREQDEERRWDSALGDTESRVNAVLDDLQNKIVSSGDFAPPTSSVSSNGPGGGGLSFMEAGSDAFKDAPAAQDSPLSFVDPNQIQSSPYRQKGLKIKPVPPPTRKVITDAWVRMNAQLPPDMILEAIENGNGNLRESVKYMRERLVTLNPQDREAREALSYLEALQQSETAYLDSLTPEGDSKHLMQAILQMDEVEIEDEGEGMGTWRASRNFTVTRALDSGGGDIEAAIRFLVTDNGTKNEYTRKAAIRYLQGLNAYQDWAKTAQQSGEK